MSEMKLTPARRRALEWYRDNDGTKFFPISISRSVIRGMVRDGLLCEQKPEFGFVPTFITEAGRAAISKAESRKPNPMTRKTTLGPDFEGVVQPVSGRFSTEAATRPSQTSGSDA